MHTRTTQVNTSFSSVVLQYCINNITNNQIKLKNQQISEFVSSLKKMNLHGSERLFNWNLKLAACWLCSCRLLWVVCSLHQSSTPSSSLKQSKSCFVVAYSLNFFHFSSLEKSLSLCFNSPFYFRTLYYNIFSFIFIIACFLYFFKQLNNFPFNVRIS